MTATVTKNTAYLVGGHGEDKAIVTKCTMYLIVDTNTVVDPGEVPVTHREVNWTARLARRPRSH